MLLIQFGWNGISWNTYALPGLTPCHHIHDSTGSIQIPANTQYPWESYMEYLRPKNWNARGTLVPDPFFFVFRWLFKGIQCSHCHQASLGELRVKKWLVITCPISEVIQNCAASGATSASTSKQRITPSIQFHPIARTTLTPTVSACFFLVLSPFISMLLHHSKRGTAAGGPCLTTMAVSPS